MIDDLLHHLLGRSARECVVAGDQLVGSRAAAAREGSPDGLFVITPGIGRIVQAGIRFGLEETSLVDRGEIDRIGGAELQPVRFGRRRGRSVGDARCTALVVVGQPRIGRAQYAEYVRAAADVLIRIELAAVALVERVRLVGFIGEVVEGRILRVEQVVFRQQGLDLAAVGVEIAQQNPQVERIGEFHPLFDIASEDHVRLHGRIGLFVGCELPGVHGPDLFEDAGDDALHLFAAVESGGCVLRVQIAVRIGDLVVQTGQQIEIVGQHRLGFEHEIGNARLALALFEDRPDGGQYADVEIRPRAGEIGRLRVQVVVHDGGVLAGVPVLNGVLCPEIARQRQFIAHFVGGHERYGR